MTPSEKYVSDLCKSSFLPFWSYPNPLGKKDKELCDVLVVCNNTIILISVKDIRVSNHKDETVKYDRWKAKAIDDSAKQLYGAERFLKNRDHIKLKDRTTTVKLPNKEKRKIFRIAVAFGSHKNFPLPTGDFGRGFVHVFDEQSTSILLKELDTITDFTDYLIAKENFIKGKRIMVPREIDFFTLYLNSNGFDIDAPADYISIPYGLWEIYIQSEEYKSWQESIKESFMWDEMINGIFNYHINSEISQEKRDEYEESLRIINLESRQHRIALGKKLKEALEKKVSARLLKPLPGQKYTYVLMPLTDKNWEGKEGELKLRCIIARYLFPDIETIIGVSIGKNPNNGHGWYDILYLHLPEINQLYIDEAKNAQEELGYFKNMKSSKN